MVTQLVEKLLKLVIFYKIIILSFFIVISGALIIIFVSPRGDLISILKNEVLKEIGIALVIIGLAILFYEYFLRKNMMDLIEEFVKINFMEMIHDHCERVKSITESIKRSGLVNIYQRGGSSEFLNLTRNNVKMLGITLSYYFYPDSEEWAQLSSLVEKGCKLQVLILNPDSNQVSCRERDENNTDLKGQIIQLIHMEKLFINNIKEDSRSNIEIRLYDTYPSFAMTIVDDNILRVTPYLFNKKGRACPTIEFVRKDKGVFDVYLNHFNDLWNKSEHYYP
ncbi:MAG: hypothetical protein C3F06_04030 [Candidatus Methanoperedenaceae archaeon]|nr:MAG: hypothetical protein C3F06_04030 [Candidatus Methanoperedenaceae archaeon]